MGYMKSILDENIREELITRIKRLDENSTALWGTMNVYQMLRHCVLCEELYLGITRHKRSFRGRIFGKKALISLLNEDAPFPKNAPTSDAFKVKELNGDVDAEKEKWIRLIKEYGSYSTGFKHWFFGKMTREQLGYFVYKHNDHHLRQFNV